MFYLNSGTPTKDVGMDFGMQFARRRQRIESMIREVRDSQPQMMIGGLTNHTPTFKMLSDLNREVRQ